MIHFIYRGKEQVLLVLKMPLIILLEIFFNLLNCEVAPTVNVGATLKCNCGDNAILDGHPCNIVMNTINILMNTINTLINIINVSMNTSMY